MIPYHLDDVFELGGWNLKTIETKIPKNEKRSNYIKLHKSNFYSIIQMLSEAHEWDLDDLVDEILNELLTKKPL
jgi:hypothetical protein